MMRLVEQPKRTVRQDGGVGDADWVVGHDGCVSKLAGGTRDGQAIVDGGAFDSEGEG